MASNRALVYLVDDDEMYLKTAQHTLSQNRAFDIKSFTTGEEALEAAQSAKRKPDVIVLDYFLNSENSNAISGLEILKKVKQDNLGAEVIMLSGQENIDVAVNSVKYGAYDYVVKNKSAFIRVQNDIKRITSQKIKDGENKMLRRFVIALLICVSIVLAIALVILFVEEPNTGNTQQGVEAIDASGGGDGAVEILDPVSH